MTPLRLLRVFCLWLLLPLAALAQPLQPIPELRARVMDQTGTPDAATLASLEARLAAFEAAQG